MKFVVIGAGYVGLSLSTLLSQKYSVNAFDINQKTIDSINSRISPIKDDTISEFFMNKKLMLTAGSYDSNIVVDSNIVIIATPTSYDPVSNQFDTSSVEESIHKVHRDNPDALIVIKSTIPVGFTQKMRSIYNENIIFSPEFLREGNALVDNLHPSRIIVGKSKNELASEFGRIMESLALSETTVLFMNNTEAEAVKLFSNTYLAMRVSFFNELDTFAEVKGMNTADIIKGVSLDPRIGDFYNNPSFGYGGYCLPKDTKQLLYSYNDVPQNLIEAIVKSNETRKTHIADLIADKEPKKVGVYRLVMKTGSDNFRDSAIFDVISKLTDKGIEVIVYEPNLSSSDEFVIQNDLETFLKESDVIVANRIDANIEVVQEKVYTRDIFNRD